MNQYLSIFFVLLFFESQSMESKPNSVVQMDADQSNFPVRSMEVKPNFPVQMDVAHTGLPEEPVQNQPLAASHEE